MKYLKQYSLFETNLRILKWTDTDKFNDIMGTIKDILLELEDDGVIEASIQTRSSEPRISFYKKNKKSYYMDTILSGTKSCFYFNEISDYIFRLKDYLPDNIKKCSILFHNQHLRSIDTTRKEFDLTDENHLLSILKDKLIYDLTIYLK